ncbi:SPOR domain-containing protein [Ramlibacter sp.]|uniref:SPOR domain-containing protein n=1 Tax=Ramlibacter sp. TaxID=1917967 RepID=UPI003D09A9F5
MALFKKRKGGDGSVAAAPPAESIETLRRRARHRLIGAAVLVVAGVVGFPLVFDTQPRPIPVDIPIEIPDRNKVKPLAVPGTVPAPVVAGVVGSGETATESKVAKVEPVVPAKPAAVAEPKVESKPEAKVEAKVEPKPVAPAEAKPEPKPPVAPPADAARAQALLEGKAASAAAAEGRFIVQVGAFAEPDKAREARLKVERAGLKTYTHVAETKDGRRIRVRVGPFATRADATKAAERIKSLGLPAAILTL